QQEIGATCGEVQTIADYFASPAHSTQRSTAVIAWETVMTGAPQREPGEDIQMWTLPAAELPMRRFSDALKAAVDGVLDAHVAHVGQIAPSTMSLCDAAEQLAHDVSHGAPERGVRTRF